MYKKKTLLILFLFFSFIGYAESSQNNIKEDTSFTINKLEEMAKNKEIEAEKLEIEAKNLQELADKKKDGVEIASDNAIKLDPSAITNTIENLRSNLQYIDNALKVKQEEEQKLETILKETIEKKSNHEDAVLKINDVRKSINNLKSEFEKKTNQYTKFKKIQKETNIEPTEENINLAKKANQEWRELDNEYRGICDQAKNLQNKAIALKKEAEKIRQIAVKIPNESMEKQNSSDNLNQIYWNYVENLFSPYSDIREDSYNQLEKIAKNDNNLIIFLLKQLKNTDAKIRLHSVRGLYATKDKKIVEPIIELLNDEDRFVKEEAINVLGLLEDKRAVEPLINELKKNLNGDIIKALGLLKDERAIEPLKAILIKDCTESPCGEIVIALRNITGQNSPEIPSIISQDLRNEIIKLYSENYEERATAAANLAKLGKKACVAVPFIMEQLELEKSKQNIFLIELSLFSILNDSKLNNEDIKLLINALKSKDKTERFNAAAMLSAQGIDRQIDPKFFIQTIDALIEELNDNDKDVKMYILCALRVKTKQRFGDDQKKWVIWWNEVKGKYHEQQFKNK